MKVGCAKEFGFYFEISEGQLTTLKKEEHELIQWCVNYAWPSLIACAMK